MNEGRIEIRAPLDKGFMFLATFPQCRYLIRQVRKIPRSGSLLHLVWGSSHDAGIPQKNRTR